MNRNYRSMLAGAALICAGLSGCTDPTVSPSSTVSEDQIFKDPGSYQAFLAKIYAGFSTTGQQGPAGNKDIQTISDEGFSQYMRLYWQHQELSSDEAVLAWGDGAVQEFNGQVWGSSNDFLGAMFARIYMEVGWANEFLRQTTDGVLSERGVSPGLKAQIQQFRAEARFLRALAYWHGVDLFGPIPVVTVNNPTPPKQNTRTEVYDFIVSELTAIQPDLPSAGAGTYGRATKEAASMLLAKVYMNAEVYTGTPHYDLAINELNNVIAGPFSLDPSYEHLFQADNHTSPEMIFPIVQDGIHTKSYGGTTFLIHASCGNAMDPADYGVDGCWWGLRLKPEAYNRSVNDPRGAFIYNDTTTQSIAIANLTNFANGIPAPKFTNIKSTGGQGSDAAFPDTDFPMFRLADAYLMYAEAVVRGGTGGDRATALGYINALRNRAYNGATGNITDAQMTDALILDERSRELYWEGHRRTDLIRYEKFSENGVWPWKGGIAAGKPTDKFRNLFPIPTSELLANKNLRQIDGY